MERHKKSQHFRIKEKVLMVERFSQEKFFLTLSIYLFFNFFYETNYLIHVFNAECR